MSNRPTIDLRRGDVLDQMAKLPDASVHCAVTSPPYWQLRDYGVDGQIGLEGTVDEHIDRLVQVFREVRRVLRSDGTLWINYGDSYATASTGRNYSRDIAAASSDKTRMSKLGYRGHGAKTKDLLGLPWRLAFALRGDGWWLRSEIIWAKGLSGLDSFAGSALPESAKDRPNKTHEHLFLLAPSADYYYDAEAVKEPASKRTNKRSVYQYAVKARSIENQAVAGRSRGSFIRDISAQTVARRNRRSVWIVRRDLNRFAHYAAFPVSLVTPCIQAGTSAHGVCAECGAPYQRVVERGDVDKDWCAAAGGPGGEYRFDAPVVSTPGADLDRKAMKNNILRSMRKTSTVGWERTCQCDTDDVIPATVLDPFSGSGTVGVACHRIGRSYVGIELSEEYHEIASRRIADETRQGRLFVREA